MRQTISHPVRKAMSGLVLLTMLATNSAAYSEAPIHKITGTGKVSEGGVTFRETITAFQHADGSVRGKVVVYIDVTGFGLGRIELAADVNCIDVEGKNAWIGAIITRSSNEELVPVGVSIITIVRDLGGQGQDIMHGEFFEPDTACGTRPALPETIVISGDFHVE